jgi:hypothetical protein
MESLDNLFINMYALGGSIPSEFGLATNIRILWLSGNDLTGSIPSHLTTLTNLWQVDFKCHEFTFGAENLCGVGETSPTMRIVYFNRCHWFKRNWNALALRCAAPSKLMEPVVV